MFISVQEQPSSLSDKGIICDLSIQIARWVDRLTSVSYTYACRILAYIQGLSSLLCVRVREEKVRSEQESLIGSNLFSDESNPLACQGAEECGLL